MGKKRRIKEKHLKIIHSTKSKQNSQQINNRNSNLRYLAHLLNDRNHGEERIEWFEHNVAEYLKDVAAMGQEQTFVI